MRNSYLFSVASRTIRKAFWLESSRLHLCWSNCFCRFICESETFFSSVRGTVNCWLQNSHTPMAGVCSAILRLADYVLAWV